MTSGQFDKAIAELAGETLRLMRIESLELLPASSPVRAETWDLIRRHHIYEAEAVQIVSCARLKADRLVSADRTLLEVAELEGIATANIEDEKSPSDL
jgi:uncharacterized protein